MLLGCPKCLITKKESPPAKSFLIELLIGSTVERRNWSQAALTAQPRRAMHGSPCKLRPSFCGSSEKSPLAITLIAGASAGLAVGTNAGCCSWLWWRGQRHLARCDRPGARYSRIMRYLSNAQMVIRQHVAPSALLHVVVTHLRPPSNQRFFVAPVRQREDPTIAGE